MIENSTIDRPLTAAEAKALDDMHRADSRSIRAPEDVPIGTLQHCVVIARDDVAAYVDSLGGD